MRGNGVKPPLNAGSLVLQDGAAHTIYYIR
jgi:hypothetical protein